MILNLKDLTAKEHTVHLQEKLDLSDLLNGRQDVARFGTLEADLQASSQSNVATVEGSLTLPVTMLCSRCLTEIDEVLNIPFREMFTKSATPLGEDAPEELHGITEDRVDLKPYVEETVWMALPYIPLCSEDCQGLCPECGVNRNLEPCGCRLDKMDPRLAGLADFFNKDKD